MDENKKPEGEAQTVRCNEPNNARETKNNETTDETKTKTKLSEKVKRTIQAAKEILVEKPIELSQRLLRKEENRKLKKAMIEFSQGEAEKAGREYYGTYPNLNSGTLNIVQRRMGAAVNFAESIIHPQYGRYWGREPRLVFFVDGSFNGSNQAGGAGITFCRFPEKSDIWNDHRVSIHGAMSANEAELVAIDVAIQLALLEVRLDLPLLARPGWGTSCHLPHIYIFTNSIMALHTLRKFLAHTPEERVEGRLYFLHPSFANMVYNLDQLLQYGVLHHYRGPSKHVGGSFQ